VKQQTFLSDHLLNWVLMLAGAMGQFAQTGFYKALAMLTIGFLEADEEFLSEALRLFDAEDAGMVCENAPHE